MVQQIKIFEVGLSGYLNGKIVDIYFVLYLNYNVKFIMQLYKEGKMSFFFFNKEDYIFVSLIKVKMI